MPPPDAARQSFLTLQRLQLAVVASTRQAWRRMSRDFDQSWAAIGPQVELVVAAGQLAAARVATSYVPASLAETGLPDVPQLRVRPEAFSGVAADGRSLSGLLQSAVVRAKSVSGQTVLYEGGLYTARAGLAPDAALAVGGRWLDTLTSSAVQDAFRLATEAEVASRPGMGYVRVINPPCCGRCAILAGRWYRYDAGFKRHPGCDCGETPALEDGWQRLSTSPDDLFDSGQVTGLSRSERERLAAGEDRNKVINTSRDMQRARITEQRRKAEAEARGQGDLTPAEVDAQNRASLEAIFASVPGRQNALQAAQRAGFYE